MEGRMQPHLRDELPRRGVMQTPEEVAAMLRLKGLGWGIKRIARELADGLVSPALDSVEMRRGKFELLASLYDFVEHIVIGQIGASGSICRNAD